jgi:predicted ATPase
VLVAVGVGLGGTVGVGAGDGRSGERRAGGRSRRSRIGQLVEALLQGCADVHILSTSREVLGLEGERVWRVMPLLVPELDSISTVDHLSRWEASALFVARACQSVTDFAPTPSSAAAIAQICRRLDGLPLALELDAPLMRTLSPEQLLARLDDGLQVLVDGGSSPSHHQRLEHAIASSYSLLTDAQRRLFNCLSVFGGGWTIEAAEAVCARIGIDVRDVLPLLDALVTKSLVVVDRDSNRGLRYRLLETLRAYAHRQLEASGDLERVRDAHGAWMLHFGEEAESHLLEDSQARWLDLLEREHHNARAALRWEMASRNAAAALSLSAAMWRFWYKRGHFTEGRAWLDQALALGDPTQAGAHRAIVLCGAAIIASEQLDLRAATSLAEQALAMANALGDERWASTALMVFGTSRGRAESWPPHAPITRRRSPCGEGCRTTVTWPCASARWVMSPLQKATTSQRARSMSKRWQLNAHSASAKTWPTSCTDWAK